MTCDLLKGNPTHLSLTVIQQPFGFPSFFLTQSIYFTSLLYLMGNSINKFYFKLSTHNASYIYISPL